MSEAEKQLREHQQQLDWDGVMVGVSRQALAEFMAEVEALREENQELRLQLITELVPDGYKEEGE